VISTDTVGFSTVRVAAAVALLMVGIATPAVGTAASSSTVGDDHRASSYPVGLADNGTGSVVDIRYDPSYASARGLRDGIVEDFVVETDGSGTVQFGPNASTRIRIENTESGQSVTLTPASGEQTHAVDFLEINAIEISNDLFRSIRVRGPTVDDVDAEINVTVAGDTGMFRQSTFAPFKIQLIDADGDVFTSTGSRTHGFYYDFDVEYNGSALAITRDPAVDEDWYVVLEQDFEYLTEVDNSADDSRFVVSTDGIGFNESEIFRIEIYRNETAAGENGNRIIGLFARISQDDRVLGPIGDDGTAPSVNRTLSSTQVPPGGQVTATLDVTARGRNLSLFEEFTPPVAGATVDRVTVNGERVTPEQRRAGPGGVFVSLDGLERGDDVSIRYTATLGNVTDGTTVEIRGNVSSGSRTDVDTPTDTLTVEARSPLNPPVDGYDADSDGRIDVTELGRAAADYANGRIDISELGAVAAAYARE